MPPTIGVLIVHGMGKQDDDFWKPMARMLSDQIDQLGVDPSTIAWQGGFWADLLTPAEDAVWAASLQGGDLNWEDLRRFVLNALGDAVAYRRAPAGKRSVYDEIQDRMRVDLAALRQKLGNADRPLVILAHSMGSAIISDYVWNAQNNNQFGRGANDFECMRTLAGLVTFGSNLPLFSLALPKIDAIAFPPPVHTLSPAVIDVAAWHNYYDKDDVLGWPLKTLSASYGQSVREDHEVNVGDLVTFWNPLSHTEYWTDSNLTDPVARQIADVARAAAPS